MKFNAMKFSLAGVIIIVLAAGCASDSVIQADHSAFVYTGRILMENPEKPVLFWPGTSIQFNFKGTALSVMLEDQNGDNYYNVFVDDSLTILDCSPGRQAYAIVENIKDTAHAVVIFKRTECESPDNQTVFHGVRLNQKGQMLGASERPNRRIEFFGNSITCGYGNEAAMGEDESPLKYRNNWLAYSGMTARNLQAEYHCTAKSGIGIMVSWFEQIMPEMYHRISPWDTGSVWDFTQWTPDVVVVNLFQNDSWIVMHPEYRHFKYRFGKGPAPSPEEIIQAYIDFIRTLRSVYPDQPIICALGSMDAVKAGSVWPDYIRKAVDQMKIKYQDANVHAHIFQYDGTGVHPKVEHHQQMADELTALIQNITGWH